MAPPRQLQERSGGMVVRNSVPLGPHSRKCLGPYGGPKGGGLFLMRKDLVAWPTAQGRRRGEIQRSHTPQPFQAGEGVVCRVRVQGAGCIVLATAAEKKLHLKTGMATPPH